AAYGLVACRLGSRSSLRAFTRSIAAVLVDAWDVARISAGCRRRAGRRLRGPGEAVAATKPRVRSVVTADGRRPRATPDDRGERGHLGLAHLAPLLQAPGKPLSPRRGRERPALQTALSPGAGATGRPRISREPVEPGPVQPGPGSMRAGHPRTGDPALSLSCA